jgi:salicylate hydroxylase
MSRPESPSIAILGAEIGGLGLAIGLLKQNISYTIYEAVKEFSVVGSGVGLGPNAMTAMVMLDPKFRELYDGIKTGLFLP